MEPGSPTPLGATPIEGGVNFAVFSSCAQRVELCLFDGNRQTARHDLPHRSGDVWHGFLPRCQAGQHYGYRVHGPWQPEQGHRCNPAKLLIDPYARLLAGDFQWCKAVYGYDAERGPAIASDLDSAPFVPKSVVTPRPGFEAGRRLPWLDDSVIYEANLRGYTMAHPHLSEAERGRFAGMCNRHVIEHLKALGITTVELMPIHDFIDEAHLSERGLANAWGYNSISFFAPARRYLDGRGLAGIRAMTDALHDAGLEVILDVVYNHTGEGDERGPTLGFRGLDNQAYYHLPARAPAHYENFTGCGNAVDTSHPQVRDLVLDSLRYWVNEMGFDGYRFDLATTLARGQHGFDASHPLLEAMASDPVLANVKLIAEPWDVGPDGYRLAQFPAPMREWNDRYRDDVRQFWAGGRGYTAALARRLHGSAELFEASGRGPQASVNFVTSHDGFTLTDLVSYEQRHNEANGEDNRDGHSHNISRNFGIEGPSDDPQIMALRRRQRLNLLATLLFSQGTPMLLAGDEMGNSQAGNNNAYAQDNPLGWTDWSGLNTDWQFTDQVKQLIALRARFPLLRQDCYVHDRAVLLWLDAAAKPMEEHQWSAAQSLCLWLHDPDQPQQLAIVFNGAEDGLQFRLPQTLADWKVEFCSGKVPAAKDALHWNLQSLAVACFSAASDS